MIAALLIKILHTWFAVGTLRYQMLKAASFSCRASVIDHVSQLEKSIGSTGLQNCSSVVFSRILSKTSDIIIQGDHRIH